MLAPAPCRRQPLLTAGLAARGDAAALVDDAGTLSHAELAVEVERTAASLGAGRRLVLLAGANEREALVAHLGALAGGHVVLLVPGEDDERVDGWVRAWDPDVVVRRGPGGWTTTERRAGSAHDLHPDLALLLTTSGSTGAPRLVRLSYDGVDANAAAIGRYLRLDATDVAVTTLPLAYCYGLSVVHAHLQAGAAVVLSERSVVDRAFWRRCRQNGVTSLAGVPHTFDLLERGGGVDLPSLRRVTQAGGRLPPEQVRRWAAAGRDAGWELFVMYGQTEATARMAYLPPHLAASRPGAVGVAVPGGALRVDAPDATGTGELVYSGPNVMLGYAERPADLALGRVVDELRTGDLGRQGPDGLFEVVGRRSRTAKLFGLRIELQVVEDALARAGTTAWCTGTSDALVVVAERAGDRVAVQRAAGRAAGVPPRAVRVVAVDALPRTSRGKVDAPAALALALAPVAPASPPPRSVAAVYAEVLGRDEVRDDDTFVGLGGDSLSYVETALRLEDLLGELPADWHTARVGALQPAARARPRLDTTVLLRAVAILLVVGSHAHLFSVLGGAHALLVVAGYNFARFRLTAAPLRERTAGAVRAVRRVLVPSVIVVAVAAPLTPGVGLPQVALLNAVVGPDALGPAWRYWFVEALVQLLVALTLLLAVPAVDRAERRRPLLVAGAVLAVGLLPRLGVLALGPGPDRTQSAAAVLWLFALGWCAARASTTRQRAVLSGLAALLLPGALVTTAQELVVLAAVLLLLWAPSVPVPRLLAPLRGPVGAVAGASLYVYLVHWQVLDVTADRWPLATLGASVAAGLLVARAACALRRVPLSVPRPA